MIQKIFVTRPHNRPIAFFAFIAAVADEEHFAALELWTLLSGLGAASVAGLVWTFYFHIRPAQW